MRASLFAMTTTTTFLGALASSRFNQGPMAARSRLMRKTAARAPWIKNFAQVNVASLADAEQLLVPLHRL